MIEPAAHLIEPIASDMPAVDLRLGPRPEGFSASNYVAS
jgi:hypothetical protein